MTPLETKAHETLLEVRECFASPHTVPLLTFMEVMGHVRDALRAFEAVEVGCPTGRHLSACTCKAAVVGQARYGGTYEKGRKK